MAKVVVPERLAASGLDLLRAAGHDVVELADPTRDELLAALSDAAALIVRSATQVDESLLAAAPQLMVVGRAGVGLDNVDVDAATARGVMVCNAPLSNVVSAAEQAVALMLSLARNIPQAHSALVDGRWERSRWTGAEMYEKVVGIVGLGRVGRLVAERLRGFGVRFVAYDPFVSDEAARELGVELADLDELLAEADFVTIHLPKNPETIGLFDAARLARMKRGARLVNTARGGIVEEKALADALETGHLAGAALDVFDHEPSLDSPVFGSPNAVVTPHLGASTHEAQDRAGLTIAEQVELALDGQFVPFAVNIAPAGASEAMRPFLPLGERLGAFIGSLLAEAPDEVEVKVAGDVAHSDRRILVLAVLRGLLGRLVDEQVTFVNVLSIAERCGTLVRDTAHPDAGEFRNLIEVRAGGRAVAGTLTRSGREPRIVVIDDHSVEVPLAHHLLVIRNDDRPGMIGLVGAVLGDARVNISFMGLGRDDRGDYALMALATDAPLDDAVADALREGDGIRSVDIVHLG